jgi:hypothetical protein
MKTKDDEEVPKAVVLKFSEIKIGEKFRLVPLQAIVIKSSESALYTKIEDISGDELNKEWIGRANCTYIKRTGEVETTRFSHFLPDIKCIKIIT